MLTFTISLITAVCMCSGICLFYYMKHKIYCSAGNAAIYCIFSHAKICFVCQILCKWCRSKGLKSLTMLCSLIGRLLSLYMESKTCEEGNDFSHRFSLTGIAAHTVTVLHLEDSVNLVILHLYSDQCFIPFF